MDHLTNLYKHKCEQLQEQINHLTKQLNEADVTNGQSWSTGNNDGNDSNDSSIPTFEYQWDYVDPVDTKPPFVHPIDQWFMDHFLKPYVIPGYNAYDQWHRNVQKGVEHITNQPTIPLNDPNRTRSSGSAATRVS